MAKEQGWRMWLLSKEEKDTLQRLDVETIKPQTSACEFLSKDVSLCGIVFVLCLLS